MITRFSILISLKILLFSFFTKDMDDPTRWELIEDYFLGRTADVEELLGVEFSLQ